MDNDDINKLKNNSADNRDLWEYCKNITPQLTKDDVHKILNSFQDMLFEYDLHVKDVLDEIQANGISADVLEIVAGMVTNHADIYGLISECYNVNVIRCFIYAVLITLQEFMKSKKAKYKEYATLIIDRYFNKNQYETDSEYEDDNDIDQSYFSRKKNEALRAFAKRLNAELQKLYCNKTNENSDSCTAKNLVYSTTLNFSFASIDISQFANLIENSIFSC